MAKNAALRLVGAGLLSLVLLACGGGGGGEPGPVYDPTVDPRRLDGEYHVLTLGRTDGLDDLQTQWGELSADEGRITSVSLSSNQGGRTDGPDAFSWDYTTRIDTSGRFVWTSPSNPEEVAFAGGLATEGDLAVVGAVRAGTDPVVYALLRKNGASSAASVESAYAVTSFGDALALDEVFTGAGATIFDGSEFCSRSGARVAGGWTAPFDPQVGTYSVEADGELSLRFFNAPLEEHRGGALADRVLMTAGGTHATSSPEFSVYVRAVPSATDARFHGTYRVVGLERLVGLGVWALYEGTVVADGSGNYTLRTITNLAGIPQDPAEAEGGYEVSSVSGLFIDIESGHQLAGSISEDGSFACVGGPIVVGVNPRIFFLIRT